MTAALKQKLKSQEITWIEVIRNAKKRGRFLRNEQAASASWYTCGCVKLPDELRRVGNGQPEDRHLHQLGLEFYRNVLCHSFNDARITFKLIQEKIKQLKREVNS